MAGFFDQRYLDVITCQRCGGCGGCLPRRRRILQAMFAVGVMDEPASAWDAKKLLANVTTDASVASVRKLSALSTVLLKNEGNVLPLPAGKKIALIGFASDGAVVHAGGSGSVVPSYVASPLEGITAAAG